MKNYFPNREEIQELKKRYPEGTRICLNSMSDPCNPVPQGAKGTVHRVDDIGTVHTNWDNGQSLGLVLGEDSFSVISTPEQEQTSCAMGGMT